MQRASELGGGGQAVTIGAAAIGSPIGAMAGWMGAAAASGNLRIEPEAGAAMKRALHNLQMDLDRFGREGDLLAQELPLGSSVQAELLKPWQTTVAEGPPQAYLSRVREFKDQLDKLVESIDVAVRKFQENEDDTANFFTQGTLGDSAN